jgi:hypothetical protein
LSGIASAQAQESPGLTQEITFTIDEQGDAQVEVTMKMNAAQWQNWQQVYGGGRVSVLKREMVRSLAPYFVENFGYEQDDINRTSRITMAARGVTEYQGDGVWRGEMDMKDPSITDVSDNVFLFTTSTMEGGLLMQQNQRVVLPEDAHSIEHDEDAFGNAIFRYQRPATEQAGLPWMLIVGLVLMGGGAVWGVVVWQNEPSSASTRNESDEG